MLGTYDVVRFWDPAIDHSATDLDRYLQTRDIRLLRYRGGATPMRFVCRELPASIALGYLGGQPTLEQQRLKAFQAAVVEVRNATLLDGRRGVPAIRPASLSGAEPGSPPGSEQPELWTAFEVDQLFDPATVQEVGEVVRQRAFFPAGGLAGCGREHYLPPVLLELLAMLRLRLAERLHGSAETGTSSAEHRSAQDQMMPRPDVQPGGVAATE